MIVMRKDAPVARSFEPSQDELSSPEHYSRIATAWAAGQDQNTPGGHRRRTRLGATLAAIGAGPGDLLEVGLGAGHLIPPLERAGWTVHGVEPAPAMLELARERAPASAGRLKAARAEELPYANDSFDVAVAVGVLEYTDMERSLPEISRVLRPGGRAVLCLRNGRSPLARWRRHVVHPVARTVKSRVQAGRRPPLRRRPTLSPARVRRYLADAGLVLRSSDLIGCEVLPDPLDVMAPALGLRAAQAAERSALLRSVFGSQRVFLAEKELSSPRDHRRG